MGAVTFAKKGSQRWLQVAVERAPEILNVPLRQSMGLPEGAEIEWLSPLRSEKFSEYRDGWAFQNKRWHLPLKHVPLEKFWPSRGPMWDALAMVNDGTKDGRFLLVEAKAHIGEIVSPRSRASEPASAKIKASMTDVQRAIAPKSVGSVDWSGTFYQYTNRIAHLHFLREQNKEKADLVNIYFYKAPDVPSPPDRAHWEGAIQVVECYLGVGRHRLGKYMHKLFIDASQLVSLAEEPLGQQGSSGR